jgi:phosphinothricin acetyltransferase
MRQRMKSVAENGLPWLIALYRGIVVGYCYASPYRPRHAYRYTLEESIYVDASTTGRGFGTALMDALIARCEQGPWRQMIAVVGDGNNNAGSLRLHKKHGFEIVGQLRSVGYKKGDWRDTVIMQRPLNDGTGRCRNKSKTVTWVTVFSVFSLSLWERVGVTASARRGT